ncbi:MAG: DUF6290 family protein [Coriobacteriia bacterium]|nr:DUF6290 family protein [Coriobacteriia bacterium]
MAKVVQGIRFEPEEIEMINEYAKFTGKSFSAVVRESTLEAIEDKIDVEILREAIRNDSGTYLTLDEVIEEVL